MRWRSSKVKVIMLYKSLSTPYALTIGFVLIALLFLAHISWTTYHKKPLMAKPHILFILADDYGWHDVGYHGSLIQTPTLDKLAREGVKLDNYYVQCLCSPSRSQLLTGRYQIHTGLQHGIIWENQANGMPLEIPTLADKMREAGYSTHMVGKWHLGFYKKEYTPTHRGFDSFFGFLTGSEDYYNHTRCLKETPKWCGYDFWENEQILRKNNEYSTHMFARKAEEVVANHDKNKPLFMYLPLQAVHAPMQVPVHYSQRYSNIKDEKRRIYAGMTTCMDEAIANVTAAFKKYGLWDNTILIFSTDNGGSAHEGASNWPLRGGKGSLWEGGVRGVGFVHSNLLTHRGVTSRELVDISDWYPTLLHLAGGSTKGLKLDGYNIWDTLSLSRPSPRKELLHNIDTLYAARGVAQHGDTFDSRVRAALRVGDWKLITGDPGNGSWLSPPEKNLSPDNHKLSADQQDKNVWLFDIAADPQERHDLSKQHPEVVKMLLSKLQKYNQHAVAPIFPGIEPRLDPDLHNGVWSPIE